MKKILIVLLAGFLAQLCETKTTYDKLTSQGISSLQRRCIPEAKNTN